MAKGDERALLMPLANRASVIRRERPDIIHTQSWAGMDGVIAHTLDADQGSWCTANTGATCRTFNHEPFETQSGAAACV
jgi:hypothetical protein